MAIISLEIINNGKKKCRVMTSIFDYSKIINRSHKRGLSRRNIADILGISEKDYSLKLCNKMEFTQREIDVMTTEVLEIAPESVPDYFFTPFV